MKATLKFSEIWQCRFSTTYKRYTITTPTCRPTDHAKTPTRCEGFWEKTSPPLISGFKIKFNIYYDCCIHKIQFHRQIESVPWLPRSWLRYSSTTFVRISWYALGHWTASVILFSVMPCCAALKPPCSLTAQPSQCVRMPVIVRTIAHTGMRCV